MTGSQNPQADFEADVQAALLRHFGDSPRGAAAIVLWAVLDSGNPENFADAAEEIYRADEWRVEPTQWHDHFTVIVEPTEE
jgi:hypothetical protein